MHRPRLFQSFGRSKLQQPPEHHRGQEYEYYNDYDPRDTQAPAWRKVLSRKPREEGRWEEEVVEYPSRAGSFIGPDAYPRENRRRPTNEEYSEVEDSPHVYRDEPYYHPEQSSVSDAIPIVQRENSLTRMRDMFTDYGRASHAVTDISLPPNTNRYTVVDSQSPVEVHNAYPSHRQPVIINNTTTHSVRPDLEHTQALSDRARGKRPEYRRDRRPRSPSSDRGSHEDEYPPCVVVVERGRRGEPDTYYVIPGGAPVIFEDEHGRELTRVGDFSGRYRPQPQRPVVIQDEQGREVYRLGFDENTSPRTTSDDYYYNRSGRHSDRDHYYRTNTEGRSYSGTSPRHDSRGRYAGQNNDQYDHHYPTSRHGSPKVYEFGDNVDHNYDRHSTRSRSDGTSRSSSPKVVYVDPSVHETSRGRSYSHASHKSSSSSRRYQDRAYQPQAMYSGGRHGDTSTIHVDPRDRHQASGPESIPSRSSTRR